MENLKYYSRLYPNMATTIQISEELQRALTKRKLFDKETYEEVIWDALEDTMELSEETKKNIKQAEKDIQEGNTVPMEQLKKKLGL